MDRRRVERFMGGAMNTLRSIVVWSRPMAMNWKLDYPYAHISIRGPGDAPEFRDYELSSDPNRIAFLVVYFDDVTPENCPDYMVDGLMVGGHAGQILDFCEEWKSKVEGFVVNCEAGIARSAGVAAALSIIYGLDDSEIYQRCTPNVHCKSLMLHVAEGEEIGIFDDRLAERS